MSSCYIFVFLLLVTCWLDVSSERRSKPYKHVQNAKARAGAKKEPRRLDIFRFAYGMGNHSFSDINNVNMTPFYSHGYPDGRRQASTYGYPTRSGQGVDYHRCNKITAVPRELTFITRYRYYAKYTHAYGIPIVSSRNVPDAALKRACYVVRFMFADRRVLRRSMYKYFGRAGVIGRSEGTRSIPEHSWLPAWWDQRARGLGGTLGTPISTGCEENLLCYKNDRYYNQDIFLHEFSHGVQEVAVRGGGIPGFYSRLVSRYTYVKYRTRLWKSTYSMSTPQEYFAEGTQSYFNVNSYAPRPDGVRGPINTRPKLKRYDPILFLMIKEVFPCMNHIYKRCTKPQGRTPAFKMDCDGGRKTKKVKTTKKPDGSKKKTPQPRPKPKPKPTTKPTDCKDKSKHCWAWRGYCRPGTTYTSYMKKNCRATCSRNKSINCKAWAKQGFCKPGSTHYRYMKTSCKKSCRIC